jgi:hypothetical protein
MLRLPIFFVNGNSRFAASTKQNNMKTNFKILCLALMTTFFSCENKDVAPIDAPTASKSSARIAAESPDVLTVYSPTATTGLQFGVNNYLVAGNGLEQYLIVDFNSQYFGAKKINIRYPNPGPLIPVAPNLHWKLMLFANGNTPAYNGIDLSAYKKLVVQAKSNAKAKLNVNFGTADDSGLKNVGVISFNESPYETVNAFKTYEFDISDVNKSDINTLVWFAFESNNNMAPGRGGYAWYEFDIINISLQK